MNIYFVKTNAYNAVVFDNPDEKYCLMFDGNSKGMFDGIDLYADNAAEQYKTLYANAEYIDPIDIGDTHFDYENRDTFFDDFEEVELIGKC